VLSSISSTGKTITDKRDVLKEEYTTILSAARKLQDKLTAKKPQQTVTFDTFRVSVNNLIKSVNSLMNSANTIIKQDYTGYMSVYDTYKTRIDKVIESLNK
jgi:vacuolar-type H+-ATPase subunit D/Vma8